MTVTPNNSGKVDQGEQSGIDIFSNRLNRDNNNVIDRVKRRIIYFITSMNRRADIVDFGSDGQEGEF